MAFVSYYSVNGKIMGEQPVGGARTDYLTDALGSVTATVDQTGTVQNTYRYKPYGELMAKTGAATDPKFLWVGSQGYRQTGNKYSDTYVRARHYGSVQGMWTTKDPIRFQPWALYIYSVGNPATMTDASGLDPTNKGQGHCNAGCLGNFTTVVMQLCSSMQSKLTDSVVKNINTCIIKASYFIGETSPCPLVNPTRKQCMQKFCSGTPDVTCPADCAPESDGKIPCGRTPGAAGKIPSNPTNPLSGIQFCMNSKVSAPDGSEYCAGCTYLASSIPVIDCVFLHELGHACGIDHKYPNPDPLSNSCNSVFGCCVGAALEGKSDAICYGPPPKGTVVGFSIGQR